MLVSAIACSGDDNKAGAAGDCREAAAACSAGAVCQEVAPDQWQCVGAGADGGASTGGDGGASTGGDGGASSGSANGSTSGDGGNTSGGSGRAAACEAFQAKLRSCGRFAASGDLPAGICAFDRDAYDVECLLQCLTAVPCDAAVIADAFHVAHCGEYDSAARDACDEQCASETYTCQDGQSVDRGDLCGSSFCDDGDPRCGSGACDDGSDLDDPLLLCEVDFECEDGEEIELTAHCDGFEDCSDGSDEADCAEELVPCFGGECNAPDATTCPDGFTCNDTTNDGIAGTCVPL